MRKSHFKVIFVLILILILAFVLRVVAVARFPAGLTADEAAQGYTAYSLLKTGRDEWGVYLPLTPRSFGDFKPPLYTYLTVPSLAVFGLNEFAVRFPAVIIGTLAVLMTFLVTKELFTGRRFNYSLALFASLFLAVSPWHFSLSRGAFEAALTVFFLPAGLWFFLKGLREPRFFFWASLFWGLNLFSYHAAKLFTPLFLVSLIFWQRQKLRQWWKRKEKKSLLLAAAVFAFFVSLAFSSLLFGGGTRVADVGIFSAGFRAPGMFLESYLSYLSPEFLFTRGAGEATYGMIPGRGVLYLFELPLLIFVFILLIKRWEKTFFPLLSWLFLASLPAALSQGVGYHANRVAVMMPAIQILSAYGLISFFHRQIRGKRIILTGVLFWVLISVSSFLWVYFRQGPKIMAPAMAYGWRETMNYLRGVEKNYQQIIVSRRFSEPQTFVAFYKAYPPEKFQEESQDWLRYQKEKLLFVDQLGQYSLGQYEFRDLHFPVDRNLKNVLLVGRPEEFPADVLIKKMIIYPDGQRAFFIVESGSEDNKKIR